MLTCRRSFLDFVRYVVYFETAIYLAMSFAQISVSGLVLERAYSDFAVNEPVTLLVVDFFMHGAQSQCSPD